MFPGGNKADPSFKKLSKENELLKKTVKQLTVNTVRSEVTGGSAGYAFADLPTPNKAGMIAYCSNCRKSTESAGNGTGVLVVVTLLAAVLAWARVDDPTQAAAI